MACWKFTSELNGPPWHRTIDWWISWRCGGGFERPWRLSLSHIYIYIQINIIKSIKKQRHLGFANLFVMIWPHFHSFHISRKRSVLSYTVFNMNRIHNSDILSISQYSKWTSAMFQPASLHGDHRQSTCSHAYTPSRLLVQGCLGLSYTWKISQKWGTLTELLVFLQKLTLIHDLKWWTLRKHLSYQPRPLAKLCPQLSWGFGSTMFHCILIVSALSATSHYRLVF